MCTRVGWPRTPRWCGRGGEKAGLAGPPFRYCTIDDCSLDTYRPGIPVTWIGTGSTQARTLLYRVVQAAEEATLVPVHAQVRFVRADRLRPPA